MSSEPERTADLLYGVPAIAKFLRPRERQARHRIDTGVIPTFRLDGTICARKSTLRQRTASKVDSLAPIIAELQAAGITSATGLAKALTERGVPTARGGSAWSTVQVQQVLARLG